MSEELLVHGEHSVMKIVLVNSAWPLATTLVPPLAYSVENAIEMKIDAFVSEHIGDLTCRGID